MTTDTAAKRGLAPSAEAWAGWLYNGGHAVMCSPQARVQGLHAVQTSAQHAVMCNCAISCTPARPGLLTIFVSCLAPAGNNPLRCGSVQAGVSIVEMSLRLQMAVTALVASLNPAIVARQNTGIDSAEVSFRIATVKLHSVMLSWALYALLQHSAQHKGSYMGMWLKCLFSLSRSRTCRSSFWRQYMKSIHRPCIQQRYALLLI